MSLLSPTAVANSASLNIIQRQDAFALKNKTLIYTPVIGKEKKQM